MTPIDLGALVVIAARALEEDVPAVLDLLDVAAAEAALAEAARADADTAGAPSAGPGSGAPGRDVSTGPGRDRSGTAGRDGSGAPGRDRSGAPGRDRSGAPGHDPETRAAARAAALLSALVEHRPLARGNQQVAVLATVTFLTVNGWQVDLEPAGNTAAVVAGLAAGRWSAADLTTWLSPRISGSGARRAPRPAPEAPAPETPAHQAAAQETPAHEAPAHEAPAHEAPAHEARTPSPAKEAPMHGWLPNLRRTARRKGDLMFRRFSPRAREVIISAQQEARALHHNYIGTEHILLGLVRDREGAAGQALHVLGISPDTVREQVLDIIGEGKQEPAGHIPFTPRAKRVLELAVREAVQLGHLYVGTEHILLGLIREGDGVGWHVLNRLGATVPKVRGQVFELMSQVQRAPSHVIAPPRIRDYDTRIELARQAKNAAIDAKDFDRAAAARESEKELLAEQDRLIAQWSAGVDVATLGRELDWLRDEVNRLQGLLLQNGIEPEQPLRRPEDPTQQSA
jgi:Clp amino terminal domain, pathogenicity island component